MGLFYFMNRDFKGVWIPKDVWLDHNLSWMEKLLLVEIDSLDAEKGCFASNGYFGEFFNLSPSRISEMVSSLVSKGYITTFLLYEGKQVKQRILTPTIPIRKLEGGIRKTEEGYSEKAKDNNTLINNTSINNTNKIYNKKFVKPTPKEVNDYAKEINFNLDGDYFCDWNEARGWLVSKNPMKDWKAAIRTWKRNGSKFITATDSQNTKIKLK
jgi:hypothetical protein